MKTRHGHQVFALAALVPASTALAQSYPSSKACTP